MIPRKTSEARPIKQFWFSESILRGFKELEEQSRGTKIATTIVGVSNRMLYD
jgi:hypothetical protein